MQQSQSKQLKKFAAAAATWDKERVSQTASLSQQLELASSAAAAAKSATKSSRKMSTPIKRQQRTRESFLRLPVSADWCAAGASIFASALISFLIISAVVAASLETSQAATDHQLHRRVKRALYDLPDGSEQLLSSNLRTTFTCDGLGYGYYADQDNECKIFHICQSFKMSDGSIYNNHWSFICPNQTIFNQVSLACSHPEDAIPCESAKEFYHVNDYFGDARAPSVRDSDLSLASDMISRSYGSRLSSPGASGQ